ncbi:long-chain-fatty-acid--CoA ligase ACSBG2-like [Palaemon carinicauda]|uniref:long-chain-fatty-acid--CoA ligase ACSBG2-like n=1 Tax=Palaemon carinicauda TaxID=392227 RepID=UPI0035B5F054
MVHSLLFVHHRTVMWFARMSFKAHRTMCTTSQTKIYRNGPDQILPTTSLKTWHPDGAVKLQISEEEIKTAPPISVYTLLHKRASKNPKALALAAKKDGKWKYWTYKDYFDESRTAAKAFIKLGLERFHGVCIMGGNAPEWVIANFGAIFAGGLSAGVYPTSTPEACRYLADNCKAQILVVEDKVCLDRFLAVKDSLLNVKAIVQWSGSPGGAGVVSWDDLMDMGKAEPEDELNERLSLAAVNQCCYLTYTSGTTGPPKGVMCSQDNLTYVGDLYRKNNKNEFGKERLVSFLPLSHIAAQVVDIYTCITILGELHFAEPDALKGSLGKTLVEVEPTGFMGVPRVWEKIYESLMRAGTQAPMYKKILAKWAKQHGLNYYQGILEHRKLSVYERVCHSLAKKLVLDKIKEAIGFGKLRQCVSVAAPVDDYLLEYFLSLDIPVVNVYGMSENITVCAFSYAEPGRFKIGSCGKIAPQIQVCIKDIPGHTPGEGEIIMKGRPVCMGYLGMPEKTHEAIDDEGWLHSGDVGHFDEDGFLYITSRIKELIITAGGENIPPVVIEEKIKKELPFISNAMLIGDNKKYLSLLLTLKAEVDENTAESLPELTPYCKRVLKRIGCEAQTVAEALDEVENNPSGPLASLIQEGIERYNSNHAISNAQKIQKWRLLPADFSTYTGEYSSTLKLKRFYVLDKYKDVIDSMYSVPC